MISEKMVTLGTKKSVIREIFEYSKKRAAEIGSENVFDFSIGNPNVPAPASVHETIKELLDSKDDYYLFGYTSAQGDADTRAAVAADLNKRFGTTFHADNFYMTCGAAASLRIVLGALTVPGDEYIVFTPYFPEYRVFIESAGAAMIETPADSSTFQIDFDRLSAAVTAHTKGVFVNSPNNPSGVVYTEENIQKLAAFLETKSAEYGHPIYLIVDEPYRELVYGDVEVPYLTKYYKNTLVCYSYSKSLSLPESLSANFLEMYSEIFLTNPSFCSALRDTFSGRSGQSMTPFKSIRYSGMTSLMLSAINTWLLYSLMVPSMESYSVLIRGK